MHFDIETFDVGSISSISLGYRPNHHQGPMVTGDGWKPKSIIVQDGSLVYEFEVNRWLSMVDGDCKTTVI